MTCCGGGAAACGSRFSGFPCQPPGPPRRDAEGNLIPYRKVQCSNEVCTQTLNVRNAIFLGADPVLYPDAVTEGVFLLYASGAVHGGLTIDNSPIGDFAGLHLTQGTHTQFETDVTLGIVSLGGPGASLVFAKGDASEGAMPNSAGGKLNVIYDHSGGVSTGTGFRYTNQLPAWYTARGPGIYYEEKYSQALGVIPLAVQPTGDATLQTNVLSSATARVIQTLTTNTGQVGRSGSALGTAWGAWGIMGEWPSP